MFTKIILISIAVALILIFRQKIKMGLIFIIALLLNIKTDEKDYYNPSEDDENWRY